MGEFLWFSSFVGGEKCGRGEKCGVGGRKCGVGGRFGGRKVWWGGNPPTKMSSHQSFLSHFLPPTPHFSPPPQIIFPQNRLPSIFPPQMRKRCTAIYKHFVHDAPAALTICDQLPGQLTITKGGLDIFYNSLKQVVSAPNFKIYHENACLQLITIFTLENLTCITHRLLAVQSEINHVTCFTFISLTHG